MKIVSWNCRYGLTVNKIQALLKAGYDADIIGIQEIEHNDGIPKEFDILGKNHDLYGDGKEFAWNNQWGGDLGLALFSKKYSITRIDGTWAKYRYVVPYCIKDENFNEICRVIHVWTKTANKTLNDNEDYIQQVIHACEDDSLKPILFPKAKNAIWLGDFNSSFQLRQQRYKDMHRQFINIMESHGYKSSWHLRNTVELGRERSKDRTFYQQYRTTNSFFNDYIFINPEAFQVKQSTIAHFNQFLGISDHCPIMAELEVNKQ